jgi:hypothetical protein
MKKCMANNKSKNTETDEKTTDDNNHNLLVLKVKLKNLKL